MKDNELEEQIRTKSTEIQTEFIMKLVKLCDEFGVNKSQFIRDTVNELQKFVLTANFNKLQ